MSIDRLLIGEILVNRRNITAEQLSHALDVQKQEKGFIGEILVKLKYVEERDIVVALVVQCGLPYIAINKYDIDPSIVALIPKEIALRERLIPLDKIGYVLSVVMTNTLSEERKTMLENLTQCRIAIFISTKSEIEDAIARNYN